MTPPRPPLPIPDAPPLLPPPSLPAALAALGVALTDAQVALLGGYLARLLSMNERLNLTAISEPEAAWTRHALDALSLVPLLADVPAAARLCDVGSGGGVPGIPLAIARPDLRVTLLDSTAKKVAFLDGVSRALGLRNVDAVAARAEDHARAYGRRYDVVTARAVARLDALLGWTAPLCKPGGRLLLIKGERADEELAEAQRTLQRLHLRHARTVPTPTGRIVEIRVG